MKVINRNNRSISFRITFSILTAFSAIFCGISFFIYYSVHTLVLKEVENQLTAVYSQIQRDWEPAPNNIESIVENLNHTIEVEMYSGDGSRLYSNHIISPLKLAAAEGFSETGIEENRQGSFEGPDHYLVLRSRLLPGSPPVIIQISKDLEDEDRFFMILLELLAVANLLGISIAAYIGYRISTRILKPVDGITRKAKAISAEDLSSRIPGSETNDEISRLIDAFNEMLERLENSFNRQQRFVADASHELRTPVSIIQGYAGMLQRWAKQNPDLMEESLDAIKSETLRMKNLIDRLLFLARSDSEGLRPEYVRTDLTGLLHESVEEIEKTDHAHKLTIEVGDQVLISCDPELIRQLMRILIDNAVKYSPAGTEVRIHASADYSSKTCSVKVKDFGNGIDSADLPRLFDRFYRVDDSRGREKGGAGLGLSIAKEICEAHGGSVSASSILGEGTEFTVILPLNIN